MKALIVYSTVYGGTVGIVEKIKEEFLLAGYETQIFNSTDKTIPDVADFDYVIVGSSILAGRWNKKALQFIEKNKDVLAGKNVAYFVSCGDAFDPSKRKEAYENYLVKVDNKYPSIKPISMGLFGGVYNPEKYNFALKLLMKQKSKYLKNVGADLNKPYDMRDWNTIAKWAQGLLEKNAFLTPIPDQLHALARTRHVSLEQPPSSQTGKLTLFD
ncbi:MAG: flavodoxin domain-containing protein [Promethearchaeota archaeon]|jgi:menaquinone-dependent protoporphyrinogen IX oxidase